MARTFRYFEKKRGNRRTGSRLLASIGEAVFFAVMLVVGIVAIILGITWLIVPEWRANHDFVETTCKIVERRIVEVPSANGALYQPDVKIAYEVGGRTNVLYTLDIHHFDARPALLSSREEAKAAMDRFADGATVPCWYDPANPEVAVVVRGYHWWVWLALLIPVSFVAIGLGGLGYSALYWGKSVERRAAAVRKLPAPELFDLPATGDARFPYVPDCGDITSSPGTRLSVSFAVDAITRLDAVRTACSVHRLERRGLGLSW